MKSKIRDCIRGVEKHHPEVEQFQEFLNEVMGLHQSYAKIRMMMEYYMFYEMISEGINPYIDSVQDIVDSLNEKIEIYFEQAPDEKKKEEMAEELLEMREEVIARMRVLTAYVDKTVVYEHVLNRVQYRFEEKENLPSDEAFAKDLMGFLLSGKDSAAVNENIRLALGQLPMRMSRTRYYELIKNSISVYKGSDRSSLDGFLYMFRTSAMLYKDENEDRYFTELKQVISELEALDYENISAEVYQIYAEKIETTAQKLNDISDLYMQIGQLINELYTLCVTGTYRGEGQAQEGETAICGVLSLFLSKESALWEEAGLLGASEEEKLDYIGESFVQIEGKQEALYELLSVAETALDDVLEGKSALLEEYGIEKDYQQLKRLFLLISSSIFADLEEKGTEEKVTEQMADEAAAELISDCKAFFSGKSRMIRRAVMANTIGKMPVFFKNAQEIADYVMDCLSQCKDEAEKYASKQLLIDMMVQ